MGRLTIAKSNTNVIIPKPQKLLTGNGTFLLTKQTRYFSDTSLSQNAIEYLQGQLKINAGYLLKEGIVSKKNTIRFHHDTQKIKKYLTRELNQLQNLKELKL